MIALRCSSLDRFRQCQASVFTDGIVIDHQDDAGALGTAAHEGMPLIIQGEPLDVETLARKHGVDADELGMLLALGRKCWGEVAHWFPDPLFEVPMQAEREGVLLTGHADLVSSVATQPDLVMDDELRIADWKFGRGDSAHDYQLRGYAWLGMTHALPMAGFDRVRVCTVRVREQSAEWASYTRAELDEWFAGLVARTREPERFSPGRVCGYCPRAATCPARAAMLQQATTALQGLFPAVRFPDNPTDCGDLLAGLLERKRWLEKLCEDVGDMVRSQVEHRGGTLPTSDGREVTLDRQERLTINVAAGWPVLTEFLAGTQPLVRLLSIGKGELEKAVRKVAGRSQGKAAVEAMYAALKKAGAIETTYQERLEVRRSSNPVPTLENKP